VVSTSNLTNLGAGKPNKAIAEAKVEIDPELL
jgi:hypothetical protein